MTGNVDSNDYDVPVLARAPSIKYHDATIKSASLASIERRHDRHDSTIKSASLASIEDTDCDTEEEEDTDSSSHSVADHICLNLPDHIPRFLQRHQGSQFIIIANPASTADSSSTRKQERASLRNLVTMVRNSQPVGDDFEYCSATAPLRANLLGRTYTRGARRYADPSDTYSAASKHS